MIKIKEIWAPTNEDLENELNNFVHGRIIQITHTRDSWWTVIYEA